MGTHRRLLCAAVGSFAIAAASLLVASRTSAAEDASPYAAQYHGGAAYLDQGWGYDTAQWWYHVSQGTVFMPYPWFVALEQASGTQLFAAPDHLERLGFLADHSSAVNPRGLPVGFSIRPVDFPSRQPYALWKGEWVGFACAACHTGQLRYHGQQIRLEGGPAHLDIEGFGDELAAAFAATASDKAKMIRFIQRVLASGVAVAPDALQQQFMAFVQDQGARRSLFQDAQAAGPEESTASGFGRLDAVHRGGNLLLSGPLGEPANYFPTTAPVSFPAIWDTPYLDWVLYNASIRAPFARNVVEALGVGAPIDPTTFLSDKIVHSVLMDNIVAIHRSLTKVQSPRWPEEILGRIDLDKARQGEAVYRQTCAGCHELIDRGTHTPLAGNADGAPGIEVKTVPLDKIGTDPRQAENFAKRMVTLAKINGPAAIPYMDAAKAVSGGIVEQWAKQSEANARIEQEIDQGKPNEFRGLQAYRARPLNGIWATAPYLHNGSVPTLDDLLKPVAKRPRIFFVGGWEFDPQHVGVEAGSPFVGAFLFDTRLPGNSNAGHPFGTDLSDADRMALVEFLKTL
jgi:hypothetical protein